MLCLVNGKWQPRTLENILSQLKTNLFSVGAVTSKKLKITFNDEQMKFKFSSSRCQNESMLQNTFQTPQNGTSQSCFIECCRTLVWETRPHKFFSLKKIDDGLILSLKLKNIDNLFCKSCQYGKSHLNQIYAKIKGSKRIYWYRSEQKIANTFFRRGNYYIVLPLRMTAVRTVLCIFSKSKAMFFLYFWNFKN